MGDVAVDTAVRQQAHQVQGRTPFPAVLHRLCIGGVFKKFAALNITADVGQVLEHHPAPRRCWYVPPHCCPSAPQADLHPARRRTAGSGALGKNTVQIRGRGIGYGVAGGLGPGAKAVHNDKSRRCFHNKPFFSGYSRARRLWRAPILGRICRPPLHSRSRWSGMGSGRKITPDSPR